MQEKRLVVLLWLTNEYSNQEVIGQVNIKMSDALKAGGLTPTLRGVLKDRKIVIANTLVGYLDIEFGFEIKDGNQARRASHSENLLTERRRRTTKNFIKLMRDHSA